MAVTPKKPAARKPRIPARPGGLAHGRWLGDFPVLSAAELQLVKCCARGEVWTPEGWDLENPVRPAEKSDANTIRAELLRYLALGGDTNTPAHDEGVVARGAWISGELNLHQCHTTARLDLKFCHFDSKLVLTAAHLPELVLSGSLVPSLRADRLNVTGGVFLRQGFISTGEVRMLGADIGGSLDFRDSSITNEGGVALNADRIRIAGNLFLHRGFNAIGAVRLYGADISGDLACNHASFENKNGFSISAQGLKVAGGLFLRKAAVVGNMQLNAARIGSFIDQDFEWPKGRHTLDGLQYGRIVGPSSAAYRVAWLNRQPHNHLNEQDWRPQPWEQLIKVLREMGHGYEAGEIAMAKQDHMRKVGIIKGPLRRSFHWLYGLLAGYGHRPVRTISAMLTVWLACAFFFQIGGSYGYVGPGTPLLNNADLAHDVAEQCGHRFETGKSIWTRCPAMPAEYTTFQPLLYSLDLILPLVDLQQDTDWAPIVEDPPGTNLGYGVFLRWLMWFEILFGWAMSLMLVAVLGRLVEKD